MCPTGNTVQNRNASQLKEKERKQHRDTLLSVMLVDAIIAGALVGF